MRSVFLYRPAPAALESLAPARRFLLIWTPAILGIGVIAIESTPFFSSANTSSWLRPLAEKLFGHIANHTWDHAHHLLRKSGHFTGYGILCVLFLRAWLLNLASDTTLRTAVWRMRSWLFAVASTAFIASADELHQTFLPSRTGLFSDVVLDTCGGIVVSGFCLGVSWLVRRSSWQDEPSS